jgi:hypothetical protein
MYALFRHSNITLKIYYPNVWFVSQTYVAGGELTTSFWPT